MPPVVSVSGSLRQRSAHGVLVIILLKMAGTIIGRISQLVVPLFLLPSDFGIFALAVFFSGLLAIGSDLGISMDLIRRKDGLEEALPTAFTLRMAVATILVVTSLGVGWAASIAYSEPRLAFPIVLLSIGLLFQALSMVPRAIATRALDFRRAAVPDSAGKFSGSFLTIGLAILGLGYWSPVYGTLAGVIIGCLLQFLATRWRPRFELRRDVARRMIRFGQFVTLATIANFVAHSVDNAIVGALLGLAPLGFYTIAYSWGVYFTSNLTSVLAPVTYPVLARVSESPERFRRAVFENLRYYGWVAWCLTAGVAVLGPTFVLAVYGPVWQASVAPMQLLAPVGLLIGYGAITGDALYALGRSRTVFLLTWLEVAILVVLLPPATLYGGLPGTSLAALVGAVVLSFATARTTSRLVGATSSDWFRTLAPPMAASLFAAVITSIALLFLPPSLTTLGIGVIAFILLYVLAMEAFTRRRFLADLRGVLRLALS